MKQTLLILICLCLALTAPGNSLAAEDGEHHSNHLAFGGGYAENNNKGSGYYGLDYINYRPDGWGVGGFYEEVDGDFDLQVIGLLFSRKWDSGWKFNFGPGIERKLEKDKYLALLRLQTGYDWHSGHWSWGPAATLDLIEDGNSTWYLGFVVGYGW